MTLQTSEQVRAVALEWLTHHCPIELKAPNGGLAAEDITLIENFIQDNYGGLWSVQALNAAKEKLRPQLTWRSPEQMDYEKEYASLTSEQQNLFGAWWFSQGSVSILGDEGFSNAAKIIRWAHGRSFNDLTFNLAVSNLTASHGLYLASQRAQAPQGRPGHADDGDGFLRGEKNPHYRAGRINHAYQEPGSKQEVKPQLDATEARWREMAEALRGNTHSKNVELSRISGRTWRETYQLRKKALNQNPAIVTKMGVA